MTEIRTATIEDFHSDMKCWGRFLDFKVAEWETTDTTISQPEICHDCQFASACMAKKLLDIVGITMKDENFLKLRHQVWSTH